MKRKLMFILLPLVFIVIGIIFAIYYNIPRVTYSYNKKYDGYVVSEVYGNASYYKIQSKFKDKDVVGIDTRAFMGKTGLEKIEFEDVTKIKYFGRLCFSECINLKEIDLSYSSLIDKNAFYNCISLEEVNIGAYYINGGAFFGCNNLKKVIFTEGLTGVGSYAFAECKQLKELYIPQNTASIGNDCFINSSLTQLTVPLKFKSDNYISTLDYVVYY